MTRARWIAAEAESLAQIGLVAIAFEKVVPVGLGGFGCMRIGISTDGFESILVSEVNGLAADPGVLFFWHRTQVTRPYWPFSETPFTGDWQLRAFGAVTGSTGWSEVA